MSLAWPAKDPDEVLDYVLDWSERLEDDVISTVTWDVPAGITKEDESNTDTTATIWLSGGSASASAAYEIGCRITTTGGRTMDQTVKLKVKER